MSDVTLESGAGQFLRFRAGTPDQPAILEVDGIQPGEEITFRGSLPPEAIFDEVPAHVMEEARRRGKEVCGYNKHCMTCFCDDDGNTTCVPIC